MTIELTQLESNTLSFIKKYEDIEDTGFGPAITDILDNIDGLESMQAVGGVVSSLLKKRLVYIQEAEEYSLGCDCIAAY